MRIDKYLKVSRIIKRRTVANDACDTEHVCVNGRRVKASYDVKEGDVVKQGQVIGYVGATALLETALGDHLHFSVSCDGVSIDPEDFFRLK